MKALIFCAGKVDGWFSSQPNLPKQALMINDEAIIDRIVRQLSSRGVRNITIVANDERLKIETCNFFRPSSCEYFADTLLSTMPLWEGEMLGILGDVFFTDDAMDAIVKSNIADDHITFGRNSESILFGSCPENYAMKWTAQNSPAFVESYKIARESVKERKPGLTYVTPPACTFQAARWACGNDRLEVHRPMLMYGHPRWVDINDWTDDFNTEDEFINWKHSYDRRFIRQPSAEQLRKALFLSRV